MEQTVIILAHHTFVFAEQIVNLLVKTAKQLLQPYHPVGICLFFFEFKDYFYPKDCPLDCGSGSCVRSGGQQVVFACMCNGTISPTKCVTK
jgi:hypothetical protein